MERKHPRQSPFPLPIRGQRVRLTSEDQQSLDATVIHVVEPFVADDAQRFRALKELPVFLVRLDDGRTMRIRGRDLEMVR